MCKLEWHTEKRKIKELIQWDKNPRKISDKQKKQLKKSLEKFNLMSIPVINTDNLIISGHQRVKILSALGRNDEEIDVRVPNRTLTENEIKEANIRENKNTGEFDYDLLGGGEFELDMLADVGFDDSELSLIFPEEKIIEKKEQYLNNIYQVIVECENELEQEKAYNLLKDNKFNCKIVSI